MHPPAGAAGRWAGGARAPGGSFAQSWADTGQLGADDSWAGVPSIVGYTGEGLISASSADPQTLLADGAATPIVALDADVIGVNELENDGYGAGSALHDLGDLNSYALEDPVTSLVAAGYTNLVAGRVAGQPCSYAFDGQWGYLDHALASGTLRGQVAGVVEYHINADEPAVLDDNTDFKSAGQRVSLYATDQYRVSDHDPVPVG